MVLCQRRFHRASRARGHIGGTGKGAEEVQYGGEGGGVWHCVVSNFRSCDLDLVLASSSMRPSWSAKLEMGKFLPGEILTMILDLV